MRESLRPIQIGLLYKYKWVQPHIRESSTVLRNHRILTTFIIFRGLLKSRKKESPVCLEILFCVEKQDKFKCKSKKRLLFRLGPLVYHRLFEPTNPSTPVHDMLKNISFPRSIDFGQVSSTKWSCEIFASSLLINLKTIFRIISPSTFEPRHRPALQLEQPSIENGLNAYLFADLVGKDHPHRQDTIVEYASIQRN